MTTATTPEMRQLRGILAGLDAQLADDTRPGKVTPGEQLLYRARMDAFARGARTTLGLLGIDGADPSPDECFRCGAEPDALVADLWVCHSCSAALLNDLLHR